MKTDLHTVDRGLFMIHQHIIDGEIFWLIQPQFIGCRWNKENKIFRSSLWNDQGELVSGGYPKFPNFGESPDTFPIPTDLKSSVITDKLDGSLLIVSKYKGKYILRTRGTSDATKLDNGTELELFRERFLPHLDEHCSHTETWNVSFLFEWLTASGDHTIVLKYDNVPDWVFIGTVDHNDYSLFTQENLDIIAKTYGFRRPDQFKFNTVDELVNAVTNWKNKEGVVLYTNKGQSLHKIKSDDYKKKHAFKEHATLESTVDLYINFGSPSFNEFKQKIGELYDWECVQMVIGHMSNVCDAWKGVMAIEQGMQGFLDTQVRPMGDPKDKKVRSQMAPKVLQAYGNTNRASFVFKLLDSKPLDREDQKKLLYQVIKNL